MNIKQLKNLKHKVPIFAIFVIVFLNVLFIIFKYGTNDDEDASNTGIAIAVFVMSFLAYVTLPIIYKELKDML